MKTLNKNQKWSVSLKPASNYTEKTPRPKIGDDDGISDRTMNALIVLFTIITVCVSIGSASANDDVKYRILLRQAMLDMDRMQYNMALVKLIEVRANTEDNANLNHMLGLCYLQSQESAEKAVFYFNLAIPFASADHEEWDLDETNAPAEVVYYLASAYEQLEDYDKAAEYYGQFLASILGSSQHPNTSQTYAIISQKAESCKLATAKKSAELDFQNVVLNQ
jgi:tetratricopeptide (TPR) repeat protein